jgi:hypothetical protein
LSHVTKKADPSGLRLLGVACTVPLLFMVIWSASKLESVPLLFAESAMAEPCAAPSHVLL